MKRIIDKLEYNSPLVLTFSLIAVIVFVLDKLIPVGIINNYFVYRGGTNVLDFIRLFLWPFGHASMDHLLGNLTFLLLIGPMLEEKYGSKVILLLMVITTLVTGFIISRFAGYGILGASGIVFMMIVLTSFTNVKEGKIPLTFVCIAFLYLGEEIYNGLFVSNDVSELGHILGGLVGIIYAFLDQKVRNGKILKI